MVQRKVGIAGRGLTAGLTGSGQLVKHSGTETVARNRVRQTGILPPSRPSGHLSNRLNIATDPWTVSSSFLLPACLLPCLRAQVVSLNQARLASINVILNGDTESPSEEEEGRDEAVELRWCPEQRPQMKVVQEVPKPQGATVATSLDVMWNGCGLNLTD